MIALQRARYAALTIVAGVSSACAPPPSVQAVDQWLRAYAQGDVEAMVRFSTPADRALVRSAYEALQRTATSSLALALPPRPLSHELLEIERKSADGQRHVVLCKVTFKNPLPFMSERVGQKLEIPKQRTRRRRFLAVKTEGEWGVKLDLARVLERTAFAERFSRALKERDFDRAAAMLASVPPPPDEANALRKSDRLQDTLREKLISAKAAGTSTSAPSRPK